MSEFKNRYIRNFIKHADKRLMAKWAIEAGYDTARDMTKTELQKLWHGLLRHK